MRSEITKYYDMKKKIVIFDRDGKQFGGVVGIVDFFSFTLIGSSDTETIRYENVQCVMPYDEYVKKIPFSDNESSAGKVMGKAHRHIID